MIPMQFPTGPGQSYLTTELADALVAAGHEVEVLHLDWADRTGSAVQAFTTETGVRVVRRPSKSLSGFGRLVRNASKFVLSGRHAASVAERHFDLSTFDAAIAWMPAIAIAPLVKKLERAGIRHRLLFIWDFFPDHHHEIGRIPGGWPLRIARSSEQRLMRRFTAIICTLPSNAEYLRRRFHVGSSQRVLVTPIWGDVTMVSPVDRAAVRRRHSLPLDVPIAVFGGQLVEGRGFDQMLAAADAALEAGSGLTFLFIGDGRLAAEIRQRSLVQTNVLYRPSVNRQEYLELLAACDVGMVATVPGVSSFSIPSKTIDYLRAALPVIAAVEHGSDFVEILHNYAVGASVPFGNAELFFAEAARLAAGGKISEAASRCLREVFDVRHAVATIVDAVGQTFEAYPQQERPPSDRTPPHMRSAAPSVRRQQSEAASPQP
jgi:glycosyltransferase involved in cell wall biosynthesis